jgi:hypothetical protein
LLAPAQPCPSPDCGSTIIRTDPAASEPALIDPGPAPRPYDAVPSTPPAASEIESPRTEPRTIGDEPMLEPNTPGTSPDPETSPADSGNELRLRPPLEPPGRSSARPATRQAHLRREVQAFVNDPADLFTPPRADRPWRYIVIHHSADPVGSFAQIDRDHRKRLGTAGCGYHFVIGNGSQSPDGQVEVATRWSEQRAGQHCRDSRLLDINDYGIGICLVGDFDNTAPSERQLAATRALVAYLQVRYDIPAQNVVTHNLAARTPTTCPGRNLDAKAIRASAPGLARNR